MHARVLVVDDYLPWRRHILATLLASSRWHVVGEAVDGLEAIHKSETLQPDLILLDISLPAVTGIEAARRILARDRTRRILFLSENISPDVVAAALKTGALGYVLKSDAGVELLSAMEAVIDGRRYISPRLDDGAGEAAAAPAAVRGNGVPHVAGFYAGDAALTEAFGTFAQGALTAGKALIVLGLVSRRAALERELRGRGVDVEQLRRAGRYRWVDVAAAIDMLLVDDGVDEARFRAWIPPLIAEAAGVSIAELPAVAMWGEGCGLLWASGRGNQARRLEQLWRELVTDYGVESLCAYPSALPPGDRAAALRVIGDMHTAVHAR